MPSVIEHVIPARTRTDATPLALSLRADGRLQASLGEQPVPVDPVRCFPWSAPTRYISLRDEGGREVALVRDPAELDPASRTALEASLVTAGFVLEIERIVDVDEEVEIRTWTVETRQGRRTFQTPRDAWPRELPGGGWLVRDVAGDLYRVPPAEGLDRRTRRHLWAFVDE